MTLIRSSLYSYINQFYLEILRKKLISLNFNEEKIDDTLEIHTTVNGEKVIKTGTEIQYLYNPNYSNDKLVNSCNITYFYSKNFDSSIFQFTESKTVKHFGFQYLKDGLHIFLIEIDECIFIKAYVESEDYKYNENLLLQLSRDLIKINIEMKKISNYLF